MFSSRFSNTFNLNLNLILKSPDSGLNISATKKDFIFTFLSIESFNFSFLF